MHLKTPSLLLLISMSVNAPSSTLAASGKTSSPTPLALSAQNSEALKRLHQQLIEAENRHDIAAVKSFVWVSPSTLFVAKTATAAEGNWAGFWGSDVVLQHLDDLYKAGPFHIEPDYDKERSSRSAATWPRPMCRSASRSPMPDKTQCRSRS